MKIISWPIKKKIFRGPSKILKNISWHINICLKYFMAPTKTLHPPPSYILHVRSLINKHCFSGAAMWHVTGLARFVGNNILFRFLTRMISWEVLNFFANLRLPLSKNSDNFLIIIYGKSKVKFRLDWNHITKLHFKRSLKQKRDLTHISSWGLGQIWNQAKYLLTK